MNEPPAISRRINAERLMLAAWPRAILLQLAHPLVAAGVAGHSTFHHNPTTAARRLHSTVRAMLALSFGDRAQQARALDGIRAIHRRVNGELAEAVGPFPAGARYSAEDPELVLWVHITLLDSVVRAYDRLVARLAMHERDAYVAEAVWVAVALGAREADVPATWPALQDRLRDAFQSGRIVVGPSARRLAPAITTLPLKWLTAPFSAALRALTIDSLPDDIRAQYGMAWSDRQHRRAARIASGLRAARRALPRAVAWWPEASAGRAMVNARGGETV
jgi:uncharacterized protein (DUF2236 family)